MEACEWDTDVWCGCAPLPGRSSSVFILISRTMLTSTNPVKAHPTISNKHHHKYKHKLRSATLSIHAGCLFLTCRELLLVLCFCYMLQCFTYIKGSKYSDSLLPCCLQTLISLLIDHKLWFKSRHTAASVTANSLWLAALCVLLFALFLPKATVM